ncbi:hypothetical protein [Methylovirgula sp. 4M-Z18]|uniref:hypothetical protein n=1 Tax=Methylovirgula sp. 4M-Z18 TaxID=2293567 RepID=UPI0011C0813C|nr:hypothetical protein [Methylovirgula sp. 4M-Z18]
MDDAAPGAHEAIALSVVKDDGRGMLRETRIRIGLDLFRCRIGGANGLYDLRAGSSKDIVGKR